MGRGAVSYTHLDVYKRQLLPDAPDTTLVIPGFTPIPAALQPYLAAATLTNELPMRPDDLDRPIRLYAVDGPAAIAAALARMRTADGRPPTAAFDDRLELLGYELSTPCLLYTSRCV